MRHRGHREPAHQLGAHHGRRPRQIAAEVMPDQGRVGLAEGPYDPGDVEREVRRVVAARRTVAAADASQIHRDRAEARVGECDQLMPPGPPELRKAVQQQDQRPVAHLGDVETRAVGGDIPVTHLFPAGHVEPYDRGGWRRG
jgi:hypothetical protein